MTVRMIPARHEAAEYYFTYIDQVPPGDIVEILSAQLPETLAFCATISEEQSRYRYASGKWSLREVLSHINDTERVFTFRALWFARGFESALPSFDQNIAIASAGADARSWLSHVEEFRAVDDGLADRCRALVILDDVGHDQHHQLRLVLLPALALEQVAQHRHVLDERHAGVAVGLAR